MNSKKKKSHHVTFNIEVKKEPDEKPSSPVSQTNGSTQLQDDSQIKEEPIDKLSIFKKSLYLNKKICYLLDNEIKKLKNLLSINRKKQVIVKKILKTDQNRMKSEKSPIQIRAISVFAAPYFRDVKKMVPPPNEDTIIKRKNHDINAYVEPPRPWTPAEHKMLLDGITAYALMSALQPLKINKDFIKRKMKDKKITEDYLDELKQELYIAEQKIRLVNRKPLYELMGMLDENIDWMTVSATNMQGIRTPEECEIMWNNFLSFNINKEAFDEDEDTKLADLAEDFEERNWDVIASALKTNRTAVQCFERYQNRLSSNLKKKYWTQEEDNRLVALINEHKCGEIIPWNKISLLMEGRTRQQVINRYERSISQVFNRAPWSPEEDGLLVGLYQKYGSCWNKMRSFFVRRSTYAIRERYCNALKPNIAIGPWSVQEDKLLISMIRKYGYGRWAKICKKLPGRTDNMCLIRAGRLLEWSVKYHSERGTGEYDPGIHDPEMFARIMRPCAPAKYCPIRNERLRSYRENGLKMLLKALEIVVPKYKSGIHSLESIDVSWMSSEMLQQVSEVLHDHLRERKKDDKKENPIPTLKYITKPPLKRKRGEEPESDDEDYFQPPELLITREEKDLIDSALHTMFEMHGDILHPNLRKTTVFGLRQCAEMSLYKAYLYKQFHCKALCDEDDDLENVVFSKVDFRETLQTVVSYFIQPPIYDNQFIVLTPNLTTMTGMETIEATENRLLSMSEMVSHSKPYMDYLCERRKCCPQCLQCLHRSGKITSIATPQTVISDMKRKSFLLDERLETAAYIEGASASRTSNPCSCKALSDSQKSVQLLRKRFMSLFLWPALFSTAEFNKDQEHIICTERAKDDNYFFNLSSCPVESQGFKENREKRKRKRKANLEKQTTKKPKSNNVSKDGHKRAQSKRKKETPPPVLRRSSRSCVLNRTSFSFRECDSNKSKPKTSHELAVSENTSDDTNSADGINSSPQLSEENISRSSSLPEENRDNVVVLQDEQEESINDLPAMPDKSKNSMLVLPEKNSDNASSALQNRKENSVNETPALPDESSDSVIVLQEDSIDSVVMLPVKDTSAIQNKRVKNKNNTSGLPTKSTDNVLVLQEESSDSVLILPEKNGNSSSAHPHELTHIISPTSRNNALTVQEESRDTVLVISEESSNLSPESLDRSSDSVGAYLSPESLDRSNDSVVALEESDRNSEIQEHSSGSPALLDRSSDSVVTLEERSSVIPEEITISSDSSVSYDQYHNSKQRSQEAVGNCVLELTEKNMCFK